MTTDNADINQELFNPDKVPEDMFGQWRSIINHVDVGDTVEVVYNDSMGQQTYTGEVTAKLEHDRDRSEDDAAEVMPQTPKSWKSAQVVVDGRIWARPDNPQKDTNRGSKLIVSDGEELIGHIKTGSLLNISLND